MSETRKNIGGLQSGLPEKAGVFKRIAARVALPCALLFVLMLGSCDLLNLDNDKDDDRKLINTSELTVRVNVAKSLALVVRVDTDAANVPKGISWVTSAEKTTFQAEITAAESVLASPLNQTLVDATLASLNKAITAFIAKLKAGTNTPIVTNDLAAAITKAQLAKNGILISVNGSDVGSGSLWVTQEALDDLNEAIDAATQVLATATGQAAVDTSADKLNSAITDFESSRKPGTKTDGFTAAQLNELIANANTAKAGVIAGTDPDAVGPQDRFVSAELLTALETAITAAALATPETIDQLHAALSGALTAFNEAVQPGNIPDRAPLADKLQEAKDAKQDIGIYGSAAEAPLGEAWAKTAQVNALEQAIESAILINDASPNASVNTVKAETTALDNAITAFNKAVNDNGPGLYVPNQTSGPGKVTITGLGAYNNGQVSLGLIKELDGYTIGIPAEVMGEGVITNGTVTVELYAYETHGSWNANGMWYVGFMVEADTDVGYEVYINETPYNFSANSSPTFSLANFTKQTSFSLPIELLFTQMYGMTFAEAIEEFTGMASDSVNMDKLLEMLTGGEVTTYAAFKAHENGIPLYKNKALNDEWNGSDRVYAESVLWSSIPMIGGSRGEKVAEAKGTVALANIPAGARVRVHVDGYNNNNNNGGSYYSFYSDNVYLNGVSAGNTVPFTVTIYSQENNDGYNGNRFDPTLSYETTVTIQVDLTGGKTYQVRVPRGQMTFQDIEGMPTLFAGNVGTVDLSYVWLRGTFNGIYDNAPIPYINLSASVQNSNDGGNGYIRTFVGTASPVAWEIPLPRSNAAREISIYVSADRTRNGGSENRLFEMNLNIGTIPAGQDKNNIVIDMGNIMGNSLNIKNAPDGTYTVYFPYYNVSSDNVQGIIDGEYSYKIKNCSGSAVSVEGLGLQQNTSYNILIVSSDGTMKYTESSRVYFVNNTGLVDYSAMREVGGLLTFNDWQLAEFSAFVFNNNVDLSTYSAIESAINAGGNKQARSRNSSNHILGLYPDNGNPNDNWLGTDTYPVVLRDNSGSASDPANPRYRIANITFTQGMAAVNVSDFTPVTE